MPLSGPQDSDLDWRSVSLGVLQKSGTATLLTFQGRNAYSAVRYSSFVRRRLTTVRRGEIGRWTISAWKSEGRSILVVASNIGTLMLLIYSSFQYRSRIVLY